MNIMCWLMIGFAYLLTFTVLPVLIIFLLWGCVLRVIHHPTTIDAELTKLIDPIEQRVKAWHKRRSETRKKPARKLSTGAKFMRSMKIVFACFSLIPILALFEALVLKVEVADNLDLAKTMTLIWLAFSPFVYAMKVHLDLNES